MALSREEEAPPVGAPEWIVTFTDMISLLVTFFVLMMTFSSMDDWDRLKVDALLDSSRAALTSHPGRTAIDPIPDDLISDVDMRRGANQPHSRPAEELTENLEEMGQRMTAQHLPLDLSAVPDGLLIRFGDDACFAPGSAEPSEALVKSLDELGRVFEHYSYLIVVEGHTDDRFRPTPGQPTAEALSCARASAAAEHLLAGSGLSPKLVQVAGLGETKPLDTNDDPRGRLRNRRVEIRILSLSKVRAAHIQAERQGREGGGD